MSHILDFSAEWGITKGICQVFASLLRIQLKSVIIGPEKKVIISLTVQKDLSSCWSGDECVLQSFNEVIGCNLWL